MSSPTADWWSDARLHVVTGKGGTGKTTVAAAMAIALAAGGRRTLLVEVENRQGIAQLFDVPPLPYEERRISTAPRGGEVWALAVEPEAALVEYLDLFYNLKRAGGLLKRMGAVDFATSIAPGLRDVLLTGKVKEAVTRVEKGTRVYDAVVLDAPPTGRIARFLSITSEVAGLAKVGPIKKQSDSVMALLRSSQTAIHIVTLLEEMPVQETFDAAAELTAAQLNVASIVVNMATEPELPDSMLRQLVTKAPPAARLARGLTQAGLDGKKLALALGAELDDYVQRFAMEEACRALLPDLGVPVSELPWLFGPMDTGGLFDLAELLTDQTVTG